MNCWGLIWLHFQFCIHSIRLRPKSYRRTISLANNEFERREENTFEFAFANSSSLLTGVDNQKVLAQYLFAFFQFKYCNLEFFCLNRMGMKALTISSLNCQHQLFTID